MAEGIPHRFYSPDIGPLDSRPALATFVSRWREGLHLEFKTLADFRSCGRCTYCHPPPGAGRTDVKPGFEVAKTVVAFANGSGGILVIGARRKSERTGQHVLETRGCDGYHYTDVQLTDVVNSGTTPPANVEIRQIGPGDGFPAAFVVAVPASPFLVGWLDESHRPRYALRKAAASVEMGVRELELRVRTKEAIRLNVEFRDQLCDQLWVLFDSVLDRPNEAPRREVTFDWVLRENPYGIAEQRPGIPRWVAPASINRAVLDMPAKMAAWSTPRDLEGVIEVLSTLDQDFAHGPLDLSELRLLSAARLLNRSGRERTRLSPFDLLSDTASEVWSGVRPEFMSSNYDESFEQVFDRVAKQYKLKLFDERTKLQSIYYLADALGLLLPLSMQVLLFYEELAAEYGTLVTLGREPRILHPRRGGNMRRRDWRIYAHSSAHVGSVPRRAGPMNT